MYSRYKRPEYYPSDEDEITDENDDEYELYRYNLPPKYDGSRFGRHPSTHKTIESIPIKTEPPEIECSTDPPTEPESDICISESKTEQKASVLPLPHISVGYEDILIISLILLISEKGDSTGDVILLLILLLTAR